MGKLIFRMKYFAILTATALLTSCLNLIPVQNSGYHALFFPGTKDSTKYEDKITEYKNTFTIVIPKNWQKEIREKFSSKHKEAEILYAFNTSGKENGQCTFFIREYIMPDNPVIKNKVMLEKMRLQKLSDPTDKAFKQNFVDKGFMNSKNSVGIASTYKINNANANQFFIRNQKRNVLLRIFCSAEGNPRLSTWKDFQFIFQNVEVL